MTSTKPSRTCCVCKKLFCCAECRERHEKKIHSDLQLKCPLCTTHNFPLQSLEDESLFCHIATAHLPLHCILCGDIFKKMKDLKSFGACKWWKTRHRNPLIVDQKCVLGTPPLDEKEYEYNGNFVSLTSPPELCRNTSTPMVVSQKSNLEFKTSMIPSFSFKTPKTNSPSLTSQHHSDFWDSGASNYVSCPSSVSQKETPFRSVSSGRGNADNLLPRSNSRKLGIMKELEEHNVNVSKSGVEDMELTGVECEPLPDSQSLDAQENSKRRSNSLKKVRFSDQHESAVESGAHSNYNGTANEEFFEACDTMSEVKVSSENSRTQIHETDALIVQKENCSPNRPSVDVDQASDSTRFVMMMIVESGPDQSTSDLINSGLKKLECIASNSNRSSPPTCSCSMKTVDSHYSVSSDECYTTSSRTIDAIRKDSSSSNSSGGSASSGGLFSTVANALKSVVKSISGMTMSDITETEQVSQREDIVPTPPSTSDTFVPMSQFATTLLQRSRKRTRDMSDSPPSAHRQRSLEILQFEARSPLPKRHRGWYRIKAREPIARMRNNRITSPRGVSSETQVFHQGSLSVGDTVLPLPSRAHQSTQTD